MRPYCRNNSNFTFREICCGPSLYDCDCNKNKHDYDDCFDTNCGCNKPREKCCDCCKDKKNDNKDFCCFPKCNNPYVYLPINIEKGCDCNPFTLVMIGYCLAKCKNKCED